MEIVFFYKGKRYAQKIEEVTKESVDDLLLNLKRSIYKLTV